MIDNDVSEFDRTFPEFDDRGARHAARPSFGRQAAMQRRDAAFREAFRRCGGILPRFPGEYHRARGHEWTCWWPGLTHAEVARKKVLDAEVAHAQRYSGAQP